VINLKAFLGYLEKGNVASFHPSGHEQYPFDNVGQNQLTMVFYKIPQCGYCYLIRFWFGYAIPFIVSNSS
jgi:hypothetical protein